MKLTAIQIHEAFQRAVRGESVRSIARAFSVTEGALRFHFRKGVHPKELRRLAFALFHARQLADQLTAESVRRPVRAERATRRV